MKQLTIFFIHLLSSLLLLCASLTGCAGNDGEDMTVVRYDPSTGYYAPTATSPGIIAIKLPPQKAYADAGWNIYEIEDALFSNPSIVAALRNLISSRWEVSVWGWPLSCWITQDMARMDPRIANATGEVRDLFSYDFLSVADGWIWRDARHSLRGLMWEEETEIAYLSDLNYDARIFWEKGITNLAGTNSTSGGFRLSKHIGYVFMFRKIDVQLGSVINSTRENIVMFEVDATQARAFKKIGINLSQYSFMEEEIIGITSLKGIPLKKFFIPFVTANAGDMNDSARAILIVPLDGSANTSYTWSEINDANSNCYYLRDEDCIAKVNLTTGALSEKVDFPKRIIIGGDEFTQQNVGELTTVLPAYANYVVPTP